jgi:hypothetical protein
MIHYFSVSGNKMPKKCWGTWEVDSFVKLGTQINVCGNETHAAKENQIDRTQECKMRYLLFNPAGLPSQMQAIRLNSDARTSIDGSSSAVDEPADYSCRVLILILTGDPVLSIYSMDPSVARVCYVSMGVWGGKLMQIPFRAFAALSCRV